MCGIFGYIGPRDIDTDAVLASLRQRGPDGEGVSKIPLPDRPDQLNCLLVHTRLAIIDLSHDADQPMTDGSGRYTIIFNGEIYNYQELRQQLGGLGHRFRTQSDTEVLLAAYVQWGKEALLRVRGMFAFAVFDRTDGTLFLARDPFGIKPLYYVEDDSQFAFASSLTALFSARIRPSYRLDHEAISRYLSFGAFIAPDTAVREIKALPPGHTLTLHNGKATLTRYYSPADPVEQREAPTEEIMAELRDILFKSVERHLVSDVPVGIFLSGGIDSTLIACIAAQISGSPVRTFTIGYHNNHGLHDETDIAGRTAARIGSDHENVLLGDTDFSATLDDFLEAIDLPSGDGLNSYFVSRAIDKKAKVILSGIGGDEIFCGYSYFRQLFAPPKARPLDGVAARLPERLLNRMGKSHLVHHGKSRDEMLLGTRISGPYGEMTRSRFRDLLRPEHSPMVAATVLELASYLPNQLLRDVDAVAMHHSLEVRVPFVDLDVVSFALSVPDRYKVLPHVNKALLVGPFFDLLPMETYQNTQKRGFELPLAAWLSSYLTAERRQALQHRAVDWGLEPLNLRLGGASSTKGIARELPAVSRSVMLLEWIEKRAEFLTAPAYA